MTDPFERVRECMAVDPPPRRRGIDYRPAPSLTQMMADAFRALGGVFNMVLNKLEAIRQAEERTARATERTAEATERIVAALVRQV